MLSTATFLRFYIRRCGKDDFRTVRILICGAEKLPVKLQDEFREKFGVLPLEGYGCTELSPVVSDEPARHRGRAASCRSGTTRAPSASRSSASACKAFTTDDARSPLPVGVEGVLVREGAERDGRVICTSPKKTAEAIRDGWYNTGDVGLIEPDGFIRITGRVSRFAKIAGEMVPLERLDEEMRDVLGSGGERVLAVAAVPDEKRGERLVVLYLPEIEARLAELLARARQARHPQPLGPRSPRLLPGRRRCRSSAAASSTSRSSATWRRNWRGCG